MYDLYDGRFINPPFFDNIYIHRDDLNIEELQMIYNMVYTNGTIIFPDKYKYFFKKNVKNLEHNYLVKKKTDNYIYQFKKNRFIDFIIMGTQKGGTTALAHNIGKHPNIINIIHSFVGSSILIYPFVKKNIRKYTTYFVTEKYDKLIEYKNLSEKQICIFAIQIFKAILHLSFYIYIYNPRV
jgi:hypothetical protein